MMLFCSALCTYRVFRWLGPFTTHGVFRRLEQDLRSENVGKSQGKCKNNALEKMTVFGPFLDRFWTVFGSGVDHIVPKTESGF